VNGPGVGLGLICSCRYTVRLRSHLESRCLVQLVFSVMSDVCFFFSPADGPAKVAIYTVSCELGPLSVGLASRQASIQLSHHGNTALSECRCH
jgi:hypothetical protein